MIGFIWPNHKPTAELLHGVLIELSRYYPCDPVCSITQEQVNFNQPETYVPIGEGHVFDKDALRQWLQREFKNPVTNLPFMIEDEVYLKKIYPAIEPMTHADNDWRAIGAQERQSQEFPLFLNPRWGSTNTQATVFVVRYNNPVLPIGEALGAHTARSRRIL